METKDQLRIKHGSSDIKTGSDCFFAKYSAFILEVRAVGLSDETVKPGSCLY